MLTDALARVEATQPLTQEALDALELALRRFVERGESPRRHGQLQAALMNLKERLESLGTDLTLAPQLRRAVQRLSRLTERALRALEFAGRLRELRTQKGLSAERLADLAGLNVSILYRIERGGFAPPSRRTLQRLAQALQVRLDDLAPVQRRVQEPARLEEAVALAAHLEELSREERELFLELVNWWALRRERYALVGPVALGQERTLAVVRELVRVLRADPEEVRELRRRLIERVIEADADALRTMAAGVAQGREPQKEPGAGGEGG